MKKILLTIISILAFKTHAQINSIIGNNQFGLEEFNLTNNIYFLSYVQGVEYSKITDALVIANSEEHKKFTDPNSKLQVSIVFPGYSYIEDKYFRNYSHSIEINLSQVSQCKETENRNKLTCSIIHDKVKTKAEEYLNSVNAKRISRAQILGLSDDGKGIKIRHYHYHPLLSSYLPSGGDSFQVIYNYNFVNCKDEYGRILTLDPQNSNTTIVKMISNFRKTTFNQLTVCDLKSDLPIYITENLSNSRFINALGKGSNNHSRLTINSQDKIYAHIIDENNTSQYTYTYTRIPRNNDTDPDKQKIAKESLQKFVQWLQTKYAAHLFEIHDKKMDAQKIELANIAFFKTNGDEFSTLLDNVNSSFSALNLMDKISWLRNITLALNMVAELEKQLQTPMDVNLDAEIGRRVN